MAGWNGIFFNGVWSCGFDFLVGTVTSGGVVDAPFGTVVAGPSFARFSGNGVNFSASYLQRSFFVNLPSCIVGFAYNAVQLPIAGNLGIIGTWYDVTANGVQLTLVCNSLGALQFYTNGGIGISIPSIPIGSASPAGTIIAGAYNFYEVLTTIDPLVGAIQLRINGNTVINFSGNTKTTTNSYVNQFRLGGAGFNGATHADDMYILDMTGSSPYNTFLGNGRIQTDGPNADSASGGLNTWTFTSPQGTDWGNCANIPANAAQFNSSSTVNARMSFRFPSIIGNRVLFLNNWYQAQEDAAGTRTLTTIYRSNNVDQVGPTPVSLPGTPTYFNQPSTIDPNTGQSWASGTVVAAGSCEIGLEVVS